jgi:hypothetical protein
VTERCRVPFAWFPIESLTVTTTEKFPVVDGLQSIEEVFEEAHPLGRPV